MPNCSITSEAYVTESFYSGFYRVECDNMARQEKTWNSLATALGGKVLVRVEN